MAVKAVAVKHLVLFDIDGTLVRCGRQIGKIFVGALTEVFGGYKRPEGYNFSGKTDPQIVLDMVGANGLARDAILARLPDMRRAYFGRLENDLDPAGMVLLPGVVRLLERLTTRRDVMLGLLTGNWRRGAEIKLAPFGLGQFFSFGAFGDDAVVRRDLVPVALERAARTVGRRFENDEVLIVGDTELDVDCAQAAGVRSVAVATGLTPIERLREAGADWACRDLEHAEREVPILRSSTDGVSPSV